MSRALLRVGSMPLLGPAWMRSLILTCQRHAATGDQKRLSQRLKVAYLLAFQFGSDLFEVPHCVLGIKPLPTVQAHLSPHAQDGRVYTATQKFFHLFFRQIATAHWTSLEWHHRYFFLSRQSIHRSGSGRSTVIKTAH
jgi:hypothetical protein